VSSCYADDVLRTSYLVHRASLLLLFMMSVACSERIESTYPALADARRDGAITRGWLPTFLPEGSRNIREIHIWDTNQSWATFEFLPSDVTPLRAALGHPVSVAGMNDVADPRVRWWPDVLRGSLDSAALRQAGFTLYKRDETLFAIDWSAMRGFIYSSPY
jgi:hypothetical protein